jgi:ribonuclease P protein component
MKWLKKKKDFQEVYQNGNKLVGKFFVIIFACNSGELHAGIVVSKKVGKAVIRNKMKRRIRAYLQEKSFVLSKKMIIIARWHSANITWKQLNQDLDALFYKLSMYENR